jgi:Phospholipase_D-nuclease N-terminal
MPLATDYPFLDIMWTMFILALVVVYVWAVIWCIVDNFSRHDHGGFAKAMWFLFLIFLPILGICSYAIARPQSADEGMV